MSKNNFYIHPTAEVDSRSKIGVNTKVWNQAQIREFAEIGSNCHISKDVYIDKKVIIGNNVKIANGVSVYNGTIIKDDVIIGPNVSFTNDRYPRAFGEWRVQKTIIKKGSSIGAGSIIVAPIKIGEYATIGAGSVVTKNIYKQTLVYGNPAKIYGVICKCGKYYKKNSDILKIKKDKYLEFSCPICKTINRVKITQEILNNIGNK
ncbi:MAG: acyltransferase [Patescibacteria group bacterium]|nr:acyltransferase [Patescibacteria group bacterium]